MPQMFRRHALSLLFALCIVLVVISRLWPSTPHRDGSSTFLPPQPSHESDTQSESVRHSQFWADFHEILKVARPYCDTPRKLEEHPAAIGFDPAQVGNVTMPDNLEVALEVQEALRKAHEIFVNSLSIADPPQPYYRPGTRGIVSTADGNLLPVFALSLYLLRQSGSDLPVELFVAQESERDQYICDIMMPVLNARCIVLSDLLDSSPLEGGLGKYQFKIFSLLFTSFEDVIFLDADSFPLRDPAFLLTSEPYISHGLVGWPDFWQVTFHDSFFRITSQAVPTVFNHSSTESGQLLVSKKSHGQTLLLAAYYNFYGPSHYYPLLSQGAPGEGDKETFFQAARRLDLPAYQVNTGPGVPGRIAKDGSFIGNGILQTNPVFDLKLPPGEIYGWRGLPNPPAKEYVFMHVNFPKLDPHRVFGDGGLAVDADGKPHRMWAEDMIDNLGFDVERQVWEGLKMISCTLEELDGRSWANGTKLCDKIKGYLPALSRET